MTKSDIRHITVICTHPRKPWLRTYKFPAKLQLRVPVITPRDFSESWAFTHAPVTGPRRRDNGSMAGPTRSAQPPTGDSGGSIYQWKCPKCNFDLPIRQRTLAELIWRLDEIEHDITGHRFAVRLDIARAQQVLRSASQAGSSPGKPRRPGRLTTSDAPTGRVTGKRAPRSSSLATVNQGQKRSRYDHPV